MAADCANPLLAQFLKEWWDTAKERNSKGATTYKRAYESIIGCPITFTHPSEAQQLTGLGSKICERLTDELKKHCIRNGLPPPKKSRKRQSLEGLGPPSQEEPSPKKPRKTKPYVPKFKTGAYAILIALSSLDQDSDQRLSKTEICSLAQEHCEASFTAPSEAGKFYTAWNSMKTLEDKDLVYAKGRPQRKYQLTEEGWDVARRIRNVNSIADRPASKHSGLDSTEEPKGAGVKARAPTKSRVPKLGSTVDFIDLQDGLDDLDNVSAPGLFVAQDTPPLSSSQGTGDAGQRLGGAPVDKYGTLNPRKKRSNDSNPDVFSLCSSSAAEPTTQSAKALWSFEQGFTENVPRSKPASKPASKPYEPAGYYDEGFTASTSKSSAKAKSADRPSEAVRALWSLEEGLTENRSTIRANAKPGNKLSPRINQESTVRTPLDMAVAVPAQTLPASVAPPRSVKASFPAFEPINLQPGTFTVQLILDTREIRAKDDRDYISTELTKKGIHPTTRALELGDFFWVAKVNDPNLLAIYGEEGYEIALDYIVERKRLDDLIASVKDRRFHEQKFRLRRSGVKNVVYLIEDITLSSEHATRYHDMMETAIGETQILDGYFIKRTAKLDDTIRYLARMTRLLKILYEQKPLHVIPTNYLDSQTFHSFITHLRTSQPDKPYNITYDSFASLASKSDATTLRDVYLKMLMCTRGLSGEKAIEVQKIWWTPRIMIEALEACEGEKEKEGLLEVQLGRHPVGRKKIGKQLSAKVAGVWA